MNVPDFILFGFTSLVFDLLYCLGYPVGRITTSAEFHPSSLKSTGVYGSGLYCASHYQDNDAYLHVDTDQQTNGQVTDRIPPIVEGWIFVGIFSFVFILGLICLLWKILKECCTPEKGPGIPNIGNTCYMNAVLQVLCWTPNFGKQLQKLQESIGLNRINRASAHPRLDISLLRLIEYVRAGNAVPEEIATAILNDIRKLDRTFNGYEQQDSFQFFNTVISGLEALSKEMMSNGQECQKDETELERLMNTSPISRLFGGVFVTVYTYTNCDHVETVFQRFTGIPVDIPVANATIKQTHTNSSGAASSNYATDRNNKRSQRCLHTLCAECGDTNLEKGLSLWTELEEMNDMSCRMCEGNGKSGIVTTTMRLMLVSLPPILVFQFNRFQQDDSGRLYKSNECLSYPEYLDMAPFCSATFPIIQGRDMGLLSTIYRLYGVVCHSGSITSGHYTSYVRTTYHQEEEFEKRFLTKRWLDPEKFAHKIQDNRTAEYGQNTTTPYQYPGTNGKSAEGVKKEASPNTENEIWYYISDSSVSECKKESALCEPTAYLLMYERN